MAELSKDAVRYLQLIERHTGMTAKAIAGGKTGMSDDAGGGLFSPALLKSFTDLEKANTALKAAKKEEGIITREQNKIKKESGKNLDKISKTIRDELSASSGAIKSNSSLVADSISNISTRLKDQIKQTDDVFAKNEDLGKGIETLSDIIKEHQGKNETAIEGLQHLRKAVDNAAKSGDDLSSVHGSYLGSIQIINNALHENGMEINSLSKAFEEADGDFNSMMNVMDESVKNLSSSNTALAKEHTNLAAMSKLVSQEDKSRLKVAREATAAAKEARKEAKRAEKERKKAENSFTNSLSKLTGPIGIAVGVFLTRASSAMAETLATGFELGGGGDIKDLIDASFLMGVSPEEASRFAAANRDVLTSITGTAMLSAGEGIKAIEGYGNIVRDTFGATGQAQLEMVSQGITTLSNMGMEATQKNFSAFTQGVENMAKTSNKSAMELFSEFEDMASNPNFQGLMMSLGQGADATTMLTDSFSLLQHNVGMNADEFMKYRKQLADERGRLGTERVVQAAFTAQLAEELGMGAADTELLQRGRGFRESLSETDRMAFDVRMTELRKKLGTELTAAFAQGPEGVQKALRLQILMQQAGIEEITSIQMREQAKVTDAVKEQQQIRLDAAAQETEATLAANVMIREGIEGAFKSPLGPAAALSALPEIIADIEAKFGADVRTFSDGMMTEYPKLAAATNIAGEAMHNVRDAALGAAKALGLYTPTEEYVREDPDVTRAKARAEAVQEVVEKLGAKDISELDPEARKAIVDRITGAMINPAAVPASQVEANKRKRETAGVEEMAKQNKATAEKGNLTAEETAELNRELLVATKEGNESRAKQIEILLGIERKKAPEGSILTPKPPSGGTAAHTGGSLNN